MAYPWAGFGAVKFRASERAVSDTKWRVTPRRDVSSNLGTATDTIVTLAIGSKRRTIEQYFEPDRFALMESQIGTIGVFVDWNRPTPVEQGAYLATVEPLEDVASDCLGLDRTRRRIRTRVEYISQPIPIT